MFVQITQEPRAQKADSILGVPPRICSNRTRTDQMPKPYIQSASLSPGGESEYLLDFFGDDSNCFARLVWSATPDSNTTHITQSDPFQVYRRAGVAEDCSKTVVVPCSKRFRSGHNASTPMICKPLRNQVWYKILSTDQNPPVYLKTAVRETVPGVRIPLPPPRSLDYKENRPYLIANRARYARISRYLLLKPDRRERTETSSPAWFP